MPDELNPYSDQDKTLSLVQQAVTAIMQNVDSITDITNNKQKAQLFANVMNMLDQLNLSITQFFPQEIVNAYAAGWELGGQLLQEAGAGEIVGDLKNAVHAQAIQHVAVSGASDMQAAIRTAGLLFIENIDTALQAVQDKIGQGLISGASTRDITKTVFAQLKSDGLTSFITSDGKRLPLDFYAMTVTRTKVRDAQVQGSVGRYNENGIDLVRINERSFTCKVCGARQGLVISLSGETAGYPTAAQIGGLPPFHPNCRHYIIPVVNALEYPPKPFTGIDKQGGNAKDLYKAEQNIRRKANEEKKQYMKMKAEADAAGQNFPSIGTWRRMKRKNDEKWKALQNEYKARVDSLPTTTGVGSAAALNTEAVGRMAQLRTAISEARRPPQAAAMTPFKSDKFELGFNPDRPDRFMIQGMPYKLRNGTDTERAALTEIASLDREGFYAKWYAMEDAGTLTENVNEVCDRINTLYKQKDKLFNVDGYNIAFGRPQTAKLGEGVNSLTREVTEEESQAILNYTGSQSTAINQYFREGKTGNEGVDRDSAILDKLLEENTLSKDVMLYRGANYRAIGGAMAKDILGGGDISKYIGATIQDKGYSSTSLGATTRFKNNVGFQIKAPAGTKGIYVEKHTATMGEHEVILPRGTTFKVVEIKTHNSDIELLVEVVQDGKDSK